MKFTSTQHNLSQGLQVVSHIASKNTTLPILNNVLIRAEKGVITLSTTNLEMGVSCTIRGKIDNEGSFTAQSRLLSDFVNLISTETVDIELVENTITVASAKTQTEIKGNPADEFPLIPAIAIQEPFACKIKDLKGALAQVVFATSHSETRPEISGVYMKFENGSLILAATDSYRLAEKSIKCTGVESREVIVPQRALSELQRILSVLEESEEEDEVTIAFQDNQVQFSYKTITLTSRLIEGSFPAYQQIIPTNHTTRVLIDKGEFSKAVKTAALFSRLGVFDVLIAIEQGKVTVSAHNTQVGKSSTEIEASVEGEATSIVLNHKFIADGLSAMSSAGLVIEMQGGSSPCVIRPAETLEGAHAIAQQDYLYIIMPIKQ